MKEGDKIPEILGTDQNGRLVKASDYAGRKAEPYRSVIGFTNPSNLLAR